MPPTTFGIITKKIPVPNGNGDFFVQTGPGTSASHEASDPGPNPLLSVLQALQIGLRTDHEIVVLAQTRTAGDQVSADDVLLQVFQRIDLRLDGSLVEDLSLIHICGAGVPCAATDRSTPRQGTEEKENERIWNR